jgi:hypothetical protein
LSEGDTDETAVVFGKDGSAEAVARHRDIVKAYGSSAELVIVGIENQMEVNYAMPARGMLYDALNYAKQCKRLENANRKSGRLRTAAEFLGGVAKGDRIAPVITLVLYYGEEGWDGPLKLSDMMDIDDDIRGCFQDYEIKVLNMREAEKLPFANEENRKLFAVVGQHCRKGKNFDFDDLEREFSGLNLSPETLAAAGAITGEQRYIDYAYKNTDKGEINMYEYVKAMRKYFREEGREEGREKGREEVNLLIKYLYTNNLMDELEKSVSDPAYQNELIAKYITPAEQAPSTDTVNA